MKYILITGVTSGIGKSLTIEYLNKGYNIIGISSNLHNLNLLTQELNNNNLITFKCDLSIYDDIDKLIGFIQKKNINISILINNAGTGIFKSFKSTQLAEIEKLFRINILGHIYLTNQILNKFSLTNICFISSLAGQIGFKDLAIYSSTKFALEGFCDALREEEPDIQITIIRPGIVDTHFFDKTSFIDYANKIRNKMQSPKYVAQEIIKSIENGYSEYTIGKDKYFIFFKKFLPKKLHRTFLNLFIN